MNRSDRYFYLILLTISGVLFSLWYIMNPNSPRFKKVEYSIYCDSIHTLKEGNLVTVNGLERGYVKSLHEEDGMVRVVAAIDERIEIPVDSKVLIRNYGLMGERVLEVLQGDAREIYLPGSKIMGSSDKGTSDLVMQAEILIDEAQTIVITVKKVLDSLLFASETEKTIASIVTKIHSIEKRGTSTVSKAIEHVTNSVDELNESYIKAKSLMSELDGVQISEDVSVIHNQVTLTVDKLMNLVAEVEGHIDAIERMENAAGKIIFDKEFRSTVSGLFELFFRIKELAIAQELRLNVDF